MGVNTTHIILQAITGRSADSDFGGTITGSDGLKLSCELDYSGVEEKVGAILTSYLDDAYLEVFPWYGKIKPIRDASVVEELNTLLIQRIQAGDTDGIYLAPPEIIDYQGIDQFKFAGTGSSRQDRFDDLRLSDYLKLYKGREVTLANLKSDKVKVAADDSEYFRDKWTVFKCVTAELDYNDTLYILAADEWYAVKDEFVT